MGSRGDSEVEPVTLSPSTLARREDETERHRAVARALHAGPPPRAPQIAEKLDALRAQIAQFRARAIDLHVKMVDLESQGDPDVRALRAAMMASVVRIEGVVRELTETPASPETRRSARGTRG